jgi:putrescine transport system substrate-binding protein
MHHLRLLLFAALALALAGCGRNGPASGPPTSVTPAADTAPQVVHVYNWGDYIAPGVLEEFTAATGIGVRYDTFDSQEMLETRLLAGRSGYDVVVASAHFLERLVPTGALRPLDRDRLPGLAHLDPRLMRQLAEFDPGNAHAAGYHWGTVGIGYDARRLAQLAPDLPLDSWRAIYDPDVLRRVAPCGVSFVDSPSDVIGTVLLALGHDPNHPTAEQLAAAERRLLELRPHVLKVDSQNQINDLAGGSICLLVTWSTNVHIARQRAAEAGTGGDFRYFVPREGSTTWFDAWAVPADAPHPAAAHAFIEFMLRPEIAARNAEYTGSASMNAAALPLLSPAMRADPGVYPDAAMFERLTPLRARSQAQSREENRIWTRFRTGR